MFGKRRKKLLDERAAAAVQSAEQATQPQEPEITPYDVIVAAAERVRNDTRDRAYKRIITQSHKPEEETKRALILPLLSALGYDIHDSRVMLGEKQITLPSGEQRFLDYALSASAGANAIDSSPIIIEAKTLTQTVLPPQQLGAYFDAVPEAQLGVMTNGVVYDFYGNDPEASVRGEHRMAKIPFMTIDMSSYQPLPEDLQHMRFGALDMTRVASYVETLREPMRASISAWGLSGVRDAIGHTDAVPDDLLRELLHDAL